MEPQGFSFFTKVKISTTTIVYQLYMIEIELLQVALGTRNGLSHIPNQIEWVAAHDFADKQGVTGLMLSGIERLVTVDEAVKESIQKVFLLQWIGERDDDSCLMLTLFPAKEMHRVDGDAHHTLGRDIAGLFRPKPFAFDAGILY